MGQSTPTTTMALDEFAQRYREFRLELDPDEQHWFDELLCRARRHSNAINRRPHLDFERPVLLSMLLEGMRELEVTRIALEATRQRLDEAVETLTDAGLVARRVRPPGAEEILRTGQRRVEDVHPLDTGGRT